MQVVTRVRALALACVGLFVVAACGPGETTSTVKEGGTLVYAIDADAQTLNPFEASDLPSTRALMPMLNSLYQLDKNLALIDEARGLLSCQVYCSGGIDHIHLLGHCADL